MADASGQRVCASRLQSAISARRIRVSIWSVRTLVTTLAILLLFGLLGEVNADSPAPDGLGSKALTLMDTWTKLCEGGEVNPRKEVCSTAVTEGSVQGFVHVAVQENREKKRTVLVHVLPKLATSLGVMLQLDDESNDRALVRVTNRSCDEKICKFELEAPIELIDRLKRSKKLTILAITSAGLTVEYEVSTFSFAAAWMSEGLRSGGIVRTPSASLMEKIRQIKNSKGGVSPSDIK
jgi:invasion protein IalB